MDSRLNTRVLILALIAGLLTAAAFYYGDGLFPKWWLMWIAALPVLIAAPKLSWAGTFCLAFAARFLGYLSLWNYYRRDVHLPLSVTLESLLAPAAAFALAVLLFRGFFRRGRVWPAVLAVPSVLVVYEFFTEKALGTFGNIGYTQLKNLPVLQLASLTGLWGLVFIVTLFAPAVAASILSRGANRRRLSLAMAGVLAGTVAFGVWRLRATPRSSHNIVVGLVSTEYSQNIFPSSEAQRLQVLEGYAAQARALAARGAQIIVLPEMSVLVSSSLSDETNRLFEQTAREARAQMLLGVLNITSHAAYNEARLYSPSGTLEAVYRKRHLVPGLEGRTTPVRDMSVLQQPEGTLGLAICRDMDYPDPACAYGKAEAGLLLVPAWDFYVDRFWHGHMALMRGVEYGYSIARSAKVGFLTVSDDRGRVLAEANASPNVPYTVLLATVPVRHDSTVYLKLGDWFAWVNLALLCGLIILWLTRGKKTAARGSAQPTAGVPVDVR